MAKRQWKMENSGTIATDGFWYPLTEDSSPTQYQIHNYLPFHTAIIENKSGEPYRIVLDPVAGASTKEYRVSDGETVEIFAEENITFHQILLINAGELTTAINEIKVTVRNY